MRKMFTVGLAAVMAMGLCACGSQKAPETTAAPAVAATTTAAASEEEKETFRKIVAQNVKMKIHVIPDQGSQAIEGLL